MFQLNKHTHTSRHLVLSVQTNRQPLSCEYICLYCVVFITGISTDPQKALVYPIISIIAKSIPHGREPNQIILPRLSHTPLLLNNPNAIAMPKPPHRFHPTAIPASTAHRSKPHRRGPTPSKSPSA